MGWSAKHLPVLAGQEDACWSVADAAFLLDLPAREIRDLVRRAALEPVGKRFDRGRGTRHVRVYRAADILRVADGEARVGREQEKLFHWF